MNIMSEAIHSTASVMNACSIIPHHEPVQANEFLLTEDDYRRVKQFLIARGEWLFVYKNAEDKRKIIETANCYVQQDGMMNV
jgi:hypothetical protein